MRVAALTADGDERIETKRTVEHAIALERELWSGEPAAGHGRGPSEVAAEVEDLLRTILRRGVTGELGSDLRAAADEALLADGLAIGEGAGSDGIGTDTEWDIEIVPEGDPAPVAVGERTNRPRAKPVPSSPWNPPMTSRTTPRS